MNLRIASTTFMGPSNRLRVIAELRAFSAVVRREWLIFVRYPSWVISLFIWPIIFPAAYILTGRALAGPDGSGLEIFFQTAGTNNFLGYIAVGTTVWMWQNVVLWKVGTTLREEQLRGTLETNWLSPTWRFSFLLGASLVQLVSMMVFLFVSVLEFGLVFGLSLEGSPLLALLMIAAAIPSIYGLGFAFASLVITVKETNAFVFLVRGMVMIFCGITYPITILPGWMQEIARWLPQTYIIHGLRTALLEDSNLAALGPDLKALAIFGVAWLTFGFLVFNWMERHARRSGAIGHY
jgi:ABC-2 type transport system permease protein